MKYSLFTVSVPEMTPEQALKKMKEYGYDGVDWRVTDIPTDPGTAGGAVLLEKQLLYGGYRHDR